MTKIDLVKPGLVALCIFFAVLWLSKSCDKPVTVPQDQVEWRSRVAEKEQIIKTKDKAIDSLQRLVTTLKKDRTSDSSRLSKVATVNFNRYRQAKADIQHLRDSIPVVQAFVEAADSLISVKDSLYMQEVGHRIAIEKLYETEVAVLAEKNVVQKQISELQATKIIDLEGQNTKLARKIQRKQNWNTFWKGLAAGTTAAAAVIILSQ